MALAHDIDIITWLADSEVKRVFGMKAHTAEGCSSPDIVFGVAELENGILCSLETQWRLPNEYGQYLDTELEVMTTKGNLKLNCPGTSLSYMLSLIHILLDSWADLISGANIWAWMKRNSVTGETPISALKERQ